MMRGLCQANASYPLINADHVVWCSLPHGHVGRHHAEIPQPGFPPAKLDWMDRPVQ